MENAQNAADHPAAQAVQDPAEHPSDQAVSAAGAAESGAAGADTAAGTDTAAGAAEMSQLGIDGARPNAPKPLSPKAKLTAWALGIGGLLSLCALIVIGVTILEWASPLLRYLYFLWIGSGGSAL